MVTQQRRLHELLPPERGFLAHNRLNSIHNEKTRTKQLQRQRKRRLRRRRRIKRRPIFRLLRVRQPNLRKRNATIRRTHLRSECQMCRLLIQDSLSRHIRLRLFEVQYIPYSNRYYRVLNTYTNSLSVKVKRR